MRNLFYEHRVLGLILTAVGFGIALSLAVVSVI